MAGFIDREANAYMRLGYARFNRGQAGTALRFYDRALILLGQRDISRRERADTLYFRSLGRASQRLFGCLSRRD